MSQNITWSSEQDESLIDFVRNHEIIFNVKCKDFRKAQLKQNLWGEIGQKLQKTAVHCSKRWAYIRDYYIRRRGKPGTGSSGEAAKKRSDLMSFLDSCSVIKASTITNIPGRAVVSVTTEDTDTEESQATQESVDNEENYANDGAENDLLQEADEDRDRGKTVPSTPQKAKKRKSSDERLQLLKKIAARQPIPAVAEKDETELFFCSMAKIVKKLPPYGQAQLRMHIGSLVGNAELKYMEQQSPYSSPSTSRASTSSCGDYFANASFSPDGSNTFMPLE